MGVVKWMSVIYLFLRLSHTEVVNLTSVLHLSCILFLPKKKKPIVYIVYAPAALLALKFEINSK